MIKIKDVISQLESKLAPVGSPEDWELPYDLKLLVEVLVKEINSEIEYHEIQHHTPQDY